MAVRQVPAMRQSEAHQSLAWLEQRRKDSKIGWASTQRLHVDCPLGRVEAERFESSLLAENFDFVNEGVAAVIALSRQTFRVFVY